MWKGTVADVQQVSPPSSSLLSFSWSSGPNPRVLFDDSISTFWESCGEPFMSQFGTIVQAFKSMVLQLMKSPAAATGSPSFFQMFFTSW
jgi:hypothetical protein